MADPGPVGSVDLVGGVWTPEAVTFRKFCMSKQKNLDPWGGRVPGTPPRSANVMLQIYEVVRGEFFFVS